jgi:two-component system, chemotaxis family, CheB/CheR fusion protein
MNQESQSTEELCTVNEEQREHTDELNHRNPILRSVLLSPRSGAVVVNQKLNVPFWNHRAEELWGLAANEKKGQSIMTTACRSND